MKIELPDVLCVTIFCPLLLLSRGGMVIAIALSSEYKLTKLILWVECPFHNVTSHRKSAFIHKPLVHIPRAFNPHDKAGKTKKVFRYKYFNIAKWLILFQDNVTNFSPKYVSSMDRGLWVNFMITRTPLRFTNHSFWGLCINILSRKVGRTYLHSHFQFTKWANNF